MAHADPGLRPGLSSSRPYGTRLRDGRSHAGAKPRSLLCRNGTTDATDPGTDHGVLTVLRHSMAGAIFHSSWRPPSSFSLVVVADLESPAPPIQENCNPHDRIGTPLFRRWFDLLERQYDVQQGMDSWIDPISAWKRTGAIVSAGDREYPWHGSGFKPGNHQRRFRGRG